MIILLLALLFIVNLNSQPTRCFEKNNSQGHWIFFNFKFRGRDIWLEVEVHVNVSNLPEVKSLTLVIPYAGDFVRFTRIPPRVNITYPYPKEKDKTYVIWNLQAHNITYSWHNSTYKVLTVFYFLRSAVKLENGMFKVVMRIPYLKEIDVVNYRIFGHAPSGNIEVINSSIQFKRVIYDGWFWRGELYFSEKIMNCRRNLIIEIWWRNWSLIENFLFGLKQTFASIACYSLINIISFLFIYIYRYGCKRIRNEILGLVSSLSFYIIFAAIAYWLPLELSLYSIGQFYHLIPLLIVGKYLNSKSKTYFYSAIIASTLLFCNGFCLMSIFYT